MQVDDIEDGNSSQATSYFSTASVPDAADLFLLIVFFRLTRPEREADHTYNLLSRDLQLAP